MIDGITLGKRDIYLGWVDITELCVWSGRKVNYANCRFYALKVLENDPMVMFNVSVFNDSCPDDRISVKTDNTTAEVITGSTSVNIEKYNDIIDKCDSSNYGYYAVRIDNLIYNEGDWALTSMHIMQDPEYDDDGELIYPLCNDGPYKGFYLGELLPGTCAIMFYDNATLIEAIKNLNYSGNKITIIGGDSFEYGEDINEVIIHNARVISQYDKEELK